MEFKLNNKGFSLREFILVLLIVTIASVFFLNMFFKANKDLPNQNFRNLAKDFAYRSTSLRDQDVRYAYKVYLYDAIEHNIISPIYSPYKKTEKCDLYESKVIFDDSNGRKVTLKCSNYLIFNENGFGDPSSFTIYKVSKWTDKELTGSNVQKQKFYNYSVNGNMILDRFMIEREFLDAYSKKSGQNILDISQVDKSKFQLEEKMYYRTMDQVE